MAYIGNIPKTGNQRKIDFPLDRVGGGSGFNGSSTDFYLRVAGDPVYPGAFQVLAVLDGSVIEPGGIDYNINNDIIEFTTPPSGSSVFFAVIFGDQLDIGTVSDGSIVNSKLIDSVVTTNKLANLSVTTDKLADNSVNSSKFANNSVTTSKIANGSITPDKLNLGVSVLPTPLSLGQIASDLNGDYYITKQISGSLQWTPLLNQEQILSYVKYGTSVRTSTFNVDGNTYAYNQNYMLDSTSASFQINLTATPATGDFIRFVDVTNRWSINNITIDSSASGSNFRDYLDNLDSELVLDDDGWEVLLVYNGNHWKIVT